MSFAEDLLANLHIRSRVDQPGSLFEGGAGAGSDRADGRVGLAFGLALPCSKTKTGPLQKERACFDGAELPERGEKLLASNLWVALHYLDSRRCCGYFLASPRPPPKFTSSKPAALAASLVLATSS